MSSEHHEERQLRNINLVAVIAGALASITAAVLASFLGVAGTLIGAALASVISSVAGALYSGLLSSTRERIQRGLRPPGDSETQLRKLRELREGAGSRWHWRGVPARRWLLVGGGALLLFAVAVAVVTGIEAAIHKPLASAVAGRHEDARTSVGAALRGSGNRNPAGQQPASSSTTQAGGSGGSAGGGTAPSSSSPSGQTAPSSTRSIAPSTSGAPPPTAPPSSR